MVVSRRVHRLGIGQSGLGLCAEIQLEFMDHVADQLSVETQNILDLPRPLDRVADVLFRVSIHEPEIDLNTVSVPSHRWLNESVHAQLVSHIPWRREDVSIPHHGRTGFHRYTGSLKLFDKGIVNPLHEVLPPRVVQKVHGRHDRKPFICGAHQGNEGPDSQSNQRQRSPNQPQPPAASCPFPSRDLCSDGLISAGLLDGLGKGSYRREAVSGDLG